MPAKKKGPMDDAVRKLDKLDAATGRATAKIYNNQLPGMIDSVESSLGKNGKVTSQTRKSVDSWSKTIAKERNVLIETSLIGSAKIADNYLKAEIQAQYGVVPELAKPARIRGAQIMKQVRSSLRNPTGTDMTPLAKNWWKWGFSHKNNRKMLLRQLTRNAGLVKDAVKAGSQIANKNLLRPGVLPKYLKKITRLASRARIQGLTEFKAELFKVINRVGKLGRNGIEYLGKGKGQATSLTSRGFKKQFLRDLNKAVLKGSQEEILAAVKKYGFRQAVMNARTLQRSVTNMVFQQRVVSRTAHLPFVTGYQWLLSPVRNFQDICDDYAGQDTDNLGSGIFAKGNVPSYPHYNCACTIAPVLMPPKDFWSLVEAGKIIL